MINSCDSSPQTPSQVYGFLCPQTNVFYAFESYETYQQFLEWMQSQSSTTLDSDEGRLVS